MREIRRVVFVIVPAFLASIAGAQPHSSQPVRVIVPFPQGRGPGSRRGGWGWGGDGVQAPGLWHGILRRLTIVLFAGASIGALTAAAQTYPSKPVRVIVPFPPGAGADIVTRIFTPRLADALGQQFIVDNRSGAAGHIGAEIAAHSPPDGYTLLLTPASIVISRSLYSKLNYDIEKDLEPIALVAAAPFVLVVHPSLPVRSVKELLALAKAKPGALYYASTGNGGTPHLATEIFKMQTKINIVHVPYKGTPPAVSSGAPPRGTFRERARRRARSPP